MPNFGDELFAEAADYYAKYRPQYPTELFQDIVHLFSLNGSGQMLDLGCGTGGLAIPLAQYFEKVTGLDPDRDMLRVAGQKASMLGIKNISWQKGSSRDLTVVSRQFKLITMGRSFHWMDQETVLNHLYKLVAPGGGAVIAGTEPARQNKQTKAKDEIIKQTIAKYLGPKRRAGNSIYTKPPKPYSELLSGSKFSEFQKRIYDTKVIRNIEQELGNLHSMSWAVPPLFGPKIDNFDGEIRAKLAAVSANGLFENKVRFEVFYLLKN